MKLLKKPLDNMLGVVVKYNTKMPSQQTKPQWPNARALQEKTI
jgi:hypothetical protein